MVGVERDAEEAAVRDHRLLRKVVELVAEARHLTVHQLDVEVGKLDVVALRSFIASARHVAVPFIMLLQNAQKNCRLRNFSNVMGFRAVVL